RFDEQRLRELGKQRAAAGTTRFALRREMSNCIGNPLSRWAVPNGDLEYRRKTREKDLLGVMVEADVPADETRNGAAATAPLRHDGTLEDLRQENGRVDRRGDRAILENMGVTSW